MQVCSCGVRMDKGRNSLTNNYSQVITLHYYARLDRQTV